MLEPHFRMCQLVPALYMCSGHGRVATAPFGRHSHIIMPGPAWTHEQIPTIAAAMMQGQGLGHPDYMLRRAAIADSLCRGLIFGPFDSDIMVETTVGTWQANLSTLFFNLTQAYVPYSEQLAFGKLIRPPQCLNCSIVHTYMYWYPAANPTRLDINTSSVRLGSFQVNDTIAAFAINIMNRATIVSLDLGLYSLPRYLNGNFEVTVQSLTGQLIASLGQTTQVVIELPAVNGLVLLATKLH
eukprot:m.121213 g.121213  ORF g.121213 m.121213 type:complete len:241 (-) comp15631_c0_seq5:84-806(-)